MKKVLLLAPRLDVTFKQGPVPTQRGSIPPIREHWKSFIQKIEETYMSRNGVSFKKLELPLWQFTPKIVEEINPDIVFVPHKEDHNFQVVNCQPYYYMQTTIPWLFSVDKKGWAGGASVYPYNTVRNFEADKTVFEKLRDRAFANGSKFEQPKHKDITLPENYVFFACQIPHDETIRYHSNVSVETALERTCEATKKLNIPLVIKGHPVNPGSMASLKDIAQKYSHITWIDDISIHQLIPKARSVVVVNSGVGMEALLHGVPVITFGRAEYDCVTNHAEYTDMTEMISNASIDMNKVYKFFDYWCNWCFDYSKPISMIRLP